MAIFGGSGGAGTFCLISQKIAIFSHIYEGRFSNTSIIWFRTQLSGGSRGGAKNGHFLRFLGIFGGFLGVFGGFLGVFWGFLGFFGGFRGSRGYPPKRALFALLDPSVTPL